MRKTKYFKTFKKKSDCDVIRDDVSSFFGSIGNCFDTALDDKKSKMQVVGSILGVFIPTGKLFIDGATCIVKNTPKAVTTIANAKRELTDTAAEEYHKFQREKQEKALEEKISKLKHKSKKKLLN